MIGNVILSILKLILILIVMPLLMGIIPAFFIPRNKRKLIALYVIGMIISMAIFQLVCIPVILAAPSNFRLVVILYSTIVGILSLIGLILVIIDIKKNGSPIAVMKLEKENMNRDIILTWFIAIALIIFQIVMFVLTQTFDGDDAYYVVQSLLTTETDTMYVIKPYTGLTTSIDLRHALASVPMWIAYIARVSGIHSTIVAHTILGIFIIPLLYMIYYQCGMIILGKDRRRLPIFMIFVSIMYIFGDVSIYTNATFMMTRTWQGKSMLANFVIMGIIWLLLAIYETENLDKEIRLGYWITLFALNIVAAMCSTSSVFLAAMLIGIAGIVMSVCKKDIQVALRLVITCVPLVIYGALFVLI